MHSAFLRTDEGWKLVADFQEVLDHDGEIRVNESEEDRDANLALIGSEAGKYASVGGYVGFVLLTRTPLRRDIEQAVDDIATFGEGCVSYMFSMYDFANTDGTHYVAEGQNSTYEPTKKRFEKCRGVVMIKEKTECGADLYVFTRNEQLWKECMEKLRVKRNKEFKQNLSRLPSKSEFDSVIYEVAEKCNCRAPGALTLDQLWIWVAAHDATFGKRATNKLMRTVALKWCNDRGKSRRWMLRWSNKNIVDRIDKRLADVLRLGDKNSRHKPKQTKTKKPRSVPQAA